MVLPLGQMDGVAKILMDSIPMPQSNRSLNIHFSLDTLAHRPVWKY
jgi:hypothetical protein